MAEALDDTIKTNAQGPKQAAVDGVSTEQHALPDQIAADRYLQSKQAARAKGLGVATKKLIPPGTD
ncbi:MAG: hypothetical protein IT442_13155 [Phycisphaeraceae bacterium]|nr:hypothetical protein [Phycisphaeraceae bacterium]